jgi:hypothetical protein
MHPSTIAYRRLRRPRELTIGESDTYAFEPGAPNQTVLHHAAPRTLTRMSEGAMKVMKGAPHFDPSDPTKTDPKHVYRVTVIFRLRQGHCDSLGPFWAQPQ